MAMIRSGGEICHPTVNSRGAGRSRGSPSGPPLATQVAIGCFSSSLSRQSLANGPIAIQAEDFRRPLGEELIGDDVARVFQEGNCQIIRPSEMDHFRQ